MDDINENITLKLSQKLDILLNDYENTLKENLSLKDNLETLERNNTLLKNQISNLEEVESSKDSELESMLEKIEKLIKE